jgi:hypothetical protein
MRRSCPASQPHPSPSDLGNAFPAQKLKNGAMRALILAVQRRSTELFEDGFEVLNKFLGKERCRRRKTALNQIATHELILDIRVINGCCDQARHTECGLHREHGQQQLPGVRADLRADQMRVEKIFEFMNHN